MSEVPPPHFGPLTTAAHRFPAVKPFHIRDNCLSIRYLCSMSSDTRPCRVCGLEWRPTRFDALTCTDACRQRLCRGQDLTYLRGWPLDVARARRFVHEAIVADIETRKAVTAMRRERRAAQKQRSRVVRLVTPASQPATAPKPRGGGGFIDI